MQEFQHLRQFVLYINKYFGVLHNRVGAGAALKFVPGA
jgi:hypothetical protein